MSEFIVCLPWRFRNLCSQFPAVKRQCSNCAEDVIMEAANAKAAEHMLIVCAACVVKLQPDMLMEECGGLVNGEKFTNIGKALHAVDALRRRN